MPLTRETNGIFCARTFAMMPKGAMLVNVGRDKHVVVADLIRGLELGAVVLRRMGSAVAEPLPPESLLWLHPKSP